MGVHPAVIITNASTGKQLRFEAKPTDRPGVYLAQVKFPSQGTWQYAVDDGFVQYGGRKVHTFAPVQIGPGSGGSGFSTPRLDVASRPCRRGPGCGLPARAATALCGFAHRAALKTTDGRPRAPIRWFFVNEPNHSVRGHPLPLD